MIALVRYGFATTLHSQRYVPPLLLFLFVVGILSSNDSGPLVPEYATCAAAVFVCSAWLTIALLSVEDPIHRMITVVAAGRSGRVLVSLIVVAVLGAVVLSVAGLVLPLWFGHHPVHAVDLLVGTEAEFTGAGVGIGIGLVCSRLVFRRQGYAFVLAVILLLILSLVPGLVPLNPMFRLMSAHPRAADLVAPVGGLLAISVVVLAVAAGFTQLVTTRRD